MNAARASLGGVRITGLCQVIMTVFLLTAMASRADATLGTVAYYAANGNVVVEMAPAIIISGLAIEGPEPFALPADDLGGFVETWENGVYWLFITHAHAPLEVKSILPAGLTSIELQAKYSAFIYLPTGDYEPYPPAAWRYVSVPEPASWVLVAASLVVAVAAGGFRGLRMHGSSPEK